MRYVILGKTGLEISELGLEAYRLFVWIGTPLFKFFVVPMKMESLFTTRPMPTETVKKKLGGLLMASEEKIVIATKTFQRSAINATKQLENSLRMLKTELH